MSDEHLSKVTLKVLAKFAKNLREARDRVDPDSERRLALATVAECMESALLTYDAAPASQNLAPAKKQSEAGVTPHQKAIEAAITAVLADPQFRVTDDVPTAIAAFLASARESGWELRPREAVSGVSDATPILKEALQLWQGLFDTAPRFEDAP